jgi:hypothetical protein
MNGIGDPINKTLTDSVFLIKIYLQIDFLLIKYICILIWIINQNE